MSVNVANIPLVPFYDVSQNPLKVTACMECPFAGPPYAGPESASYVVCKKNGGLNKFGADTILENCPLRTAAVVVYLGRPETPKKVRTRKPSPVPADY